MSEPLWDDGLLGNPHEASDKARRVRGMFDAIAPRYALVNTIFSGGRDAYWRRRAAELARPAACDDVLDVASGTGDFGRALARGGVNTVVGCDFAHEMLIQARQLQAANSGDGSTAATEGTIPKARRFRTPPIRVVEADALRLPFSDSSFSIVSCAFGVRNFADLDAGLREMHRVLRRGGRAVILEFTRPGNVAFRLAYEFYAEKIMPIAASWVAGDRTGAYRYLPRSVVSFLDAQQMVGRLQAAGFSTASATPLTFGIVTAYLAKRD